MTNEEVIRAFRAIYDSMKVKGFEIQECFHVIDEVITEWREFYILNNTAWLGTDKGIEVYPAVKKAVEALEKQIPKKPNIVINKIKYYNCGSCGSNVRFEDEYRYLHYCGICGQAIDWSEEDDSERID